MYVPGNIIFFDPFYYKTGDSDKKFFLVIKVDSQKTILASLPTSQPHMPADVVIAHGCIHKPDSGICSYIFKAGSLITDNGWSFSKDTFLHGHWLDDYEITTLNTKYTIEGLEYEVKGKLKDTELAAVIDCFKNSPVVKRKYKRMLN